MTDENNLTPPPVEDDVEVVEEAKPSEVELPPAFVAGRTASWDQPSRPGKWATIGCGLGIVLLITALFVGSKLLEKTVWAGFATTCRSLEANLPGDLPPGERVRLTRNIDRFAERMQTLDEPFEIMGEFQKLTRAAMDDRGITHDEVEEINVFIESVLPPDKRDVPYSMP
ncbi:MAG: hypothetical protein V2I67_12420 [Thermoanaerobaculales bacterium]|nr:hypothetical protein [Thermoanaerobaculales bacterium]